MRRAVVLLTVLTATAPAAAQQLPGTKPLTTKDDLAAVMVEGIDRDLDKRLAAALLGALVLAAMAAALVGEFKRFPIATAAGFARQRCAEQSILGPLRHACVAAAGGSLCHLRAQSRCLARRHGVGLLSAQSWRDLGRGGGQQRCAAAREHH